MISESKIILASESPRRKELMLSAFRLKPENLTIIKSGFNEDLSHDLYRNKPEEYVVETAKQKALAVYRKLATTVNDYDVLLSCDTCVMLENRILEKPQDAKHAKEMLSALSSNTHRVCSAVCLIFPPNSKWNHNDNAEPKIVTFYDLTYVTFDALSDEFMDYYISTGEPFDKAGGYGIQSAMIPATVNGCFFNVVGLPTTALHRQFAIHCHHSNKK